MIPGIGAMVNGIQTFAIQSDVNDIGLGDHLYGGGGPSTPVVCLVYVTATVGSINPNPQDTTSANSGRAMSLDDFVAGSTVIIVVTPTGKIGGSGGSGGEGEVEANKRFAGGGGGAGTNPGAFGGQGGLEGPGTDGGVEFGGAGAPAQSDTLVTSDRNPAAGGAGGWAVECTLPLVEVGVINYGEIWGGGGGGGGAVDTGVPTNAGGNGGDVAQAGQAQLPGVRAAGGAAGKALFISGGGPGGSGQPGVVIHDSGDIRGTIIYP